MAYLVKKCILEKLEKGLMMRSLVPSCGGKEDRLLGESCILEKMEK